MYTKTWDLLLPETDISINRRFQRKLQSPDKGPSLERSNSSHILSGSENPALLCAYRPWAVGQNYFVSYSTHLGNTWFMVCLKDI